MNDLLDVIALPHVQARWVPVEESPKRYDASCFCADSGTTSKLKDGCHQFQRSAPAGRTKVALAALEKSAYEAWKSKDAKFWDTFLSDKFVGWGSSGKLDKASATKEYTGADCEINSYALSDEQMSPLGKDAALITYRATVDGTCGGQRIPANSWAAGVYVRDGDEWKAAFHAEAPVVDLKAAPVKPVDKKETRKEDKAKPTDRDARTDAAGTMLSPTVGILTFEATADGTCYGQKVGPIWGTSVYVKDGDAWRWTFGINLPARREGA